MLTLAVLFGLAWTGYAGYRLWLAISSARWPHAVGHVVRCSYARDNDPSQLDSFRLHVLYRYTVGGVQYESDVLTIGAGKFMPHHVATSTARQYAPGTAVTVHYRPDNPAVGVLHGGRYARALFNAAMAATCATALIVWAATR